MIQELVYDVKEKPMAKETDIRIALLQVGLSQIELAYLVGLHPSTISRVVNGWHIPSERVQQAIREALGPAGKTIRFGSRKSRGNNHSTEAAAG